MPTYKRQLSHISILLLIEEAFTRRLYYDFFRHFAALFHMMPFLLLTTPLYFDAQDDAMLICTEQYMATPLRLALIVAPLAQSGRRRSFTSMGWLLSL